mmetsp:Transcript_8762/g.17646  ORF Transcript_8762/g.17646 Transcript_8762/m.17646 type:complete len:317 (+) Transcript_8762:75-1025(+)
MTDVSALAAQLHALQAQLVGALQAEYFCDDLVPPPEAFGWEETRLRSFFESGGDAEPVPPAAAAAPDRAAVVPGQPGGGRLQPITELNPPVDVPTLAPTLKALVGGDGVAAAMRYQQSAIAAGIPDLQEGLFPPGDALLKQLSTQYQPYTKALVAKTVGGGFGWQRVPNGWSCGGSACSHGIDLRFFVLPGKEPKLLGALRFSDGALIGRGFAGTSVHGGAVETALDEATAECCKCKIFPVASTVKIEFKISRRVVPQTTYRVECELLKILSANLKCDVAGRIIELDPDTRGNQVVVASCVATMANPAQIPGQGYD